MDILKNVIGRVRKKNIYNYPKEINQKKGEKMLTNYHTSQNLKRGI